MIRLYEYTVWNEIEEVVGGVEEGVYVDSGAGGGVSLRHSAHHVPANEAPPGKSHTSNCSHGVFATISISGPAPSGKPKVGSKNKVSCAGSLRNRTWTIDDLPARPIPMTSTRGSSCDPWCVAARTAALESEQVKRPRMGASEDDKQARYEEGWDVGQTLTRRAVKVMLDLYVRMWECRLYIRVSIVSLIKI